MQNSPQKPRIRRKEVPIGLKPNGMSYTAMIIDDSKTAREILKQVLLSVQFKIFDEAINGEVALNKLRASSIKPDFVFVDYEMAIMNGVETVKQIKPLLTNETRIIMVTSHSEKEMVMKMIDMGVCGYIRKPYERDTVIKSLTSILRGCE
jgi:two-component system chemotaxis response regulator CheY